MPEILELGEGKKSSKTTTKSIVGQKENLFHTAIAKVMATPTMQDFPYPENLEWIRQILLKPSIKKKIDYCMQDMARTFLSRMQSFINSENKWVKPQVVKNIWKKCYIAIYGEDMNAVLECIYPSNNPDNKDLDSYIPNALISLYPVIQDLEILRFRFHIEWTDPVNSEYTTRLDHNNNGEFGVTSWKRSENPTFTIVKPIFIEIGLHLNKSITDEDRAYATEQLQKKS